MKLCDTLALDRTHLANERTLLAYVRTAIMLGVSGVTLLKFFPESHSAQVTGCTLLPIGILLAAGSLWRFLRLREAISRRVES